VRVALAGADLDRVKVRNGAHGALVEYASAYPGVDLRYTITGSSIKEEFVIQRASARRTFTFRILDPQHLLGTPSTDESGKTTFGAELVDGAHFTLDAPAAWEVEPTGSASPSKPAGDDSAEDGAAYDQTSATQIVRRTGYGYQVRLALDSAWARDHEFPIVLDPSVSYTYPDETLSSAFAPVGDTDCGGGPCVLSSLGNGAIYTEASVGCSFCDPEEAEATATPEIRGYVHFDLSNIPQDTLLSSATFSVQTQEYGRELKVHRADALLEPGDTGADLATAQGREVGRLSPWSNEPFAADVTYVVQDWIDDGDGGDAGFTLQETSLFDGEARQTSDPAACAITPSDIAADGLPGCFYDPVLTLETAYDPLPTPINVEQTWGCDCRWAHGANLSGRAADPVNTADGSANETFTDLTVPAPGVSVAFRRTYNGADSLDGPLGLGWTFEYNASLVENPSTGDIVFRDPSGGQSGFTLLPGGSYLPDPSVTGQLESLPGGGWTLTSLSGEQLTFDSDGFELSDKDASGRGVTLGYAGSGPSRRLTSITDEAGHQTVLAYGSAGAAAGKLIEVTSPDGRSVQYEYAIVAGGARLTSVTAPDGAETTLAYDSAGGGLSGITTPGDNSNAQNVYDPTTGRIVEQTDATGAVWHFAWDTDATSGRVTQTTTDPVGGETVDVYYGNVRIKHIDGNGNATRYYYDATLNLVAIVNAYGEVTEMTYDEAGNMLSRTVPDWASPLQESWTYDAQNRVTSHTSLGQRTTTFAYNADNQLISETDGLDHTTEYTYTDDGLVETITSPEGRVTTFGYDQRGNQTSVDVAGDATTMTYDNAGNMLSTTTPRGNETGADPNDFTTWFTYDDANRVVTATDPTGAVATNAYDDDDDGNLTEVVTVASSAPGSSVLDERTFTYDEAGRVLTSSVFDHTTTNVYDDAGHLVSSTDPSGATTTYTYTPGGQRNTMTTPRGNVSGATPEDYTWTYGYDATNYLQTVEDPEGRLTDTYHDILGRVVATQSPMGAFTWATYDGDGHITEYTDHRDRTTTRSYDDAGRNVTKALPGQSPAVFTYDDDGLKTSQTSPSGTRTTTFRHNTAGQVEASVSPAGNAPGGDPADHTTSYGYDADGNQISQTDALGHTTTWEYDPAGNQTSQTDAKNRTTTWTYDQLNRLTEVNPPTSGGGATYEYDQYGNLTSRTDARGQTTTYDHDPLRHVTAITDPLERTRTFDYDPEGRLASWTTARGEDASDPATWTVTQTYDARGLLTARDTDDPDYSSTFAYDDDGHPTETVDATGTTTFTYRGDLVESISRPDGDYGYGYNDAGQVTHRSYPNGQGSTVGYDDDGLPTWQAVYDDTPYDETDDKVVTYEYNADGLLEQLVYPDGTDLTQDITRDATGRITDITNQASGATDPLSSISYTYDAVGNPTQVTTSRGTTTTDEAFTYDDLDQLTKYCPGHDDCTAATNYVAYGYDDAGNRAQQQRVGVADPGTTTFTYDAANQLTSQTTTLTGGSPNTTTYDYTADGQLTSDGRTWNVLGQLVESDVSGEASHTYDAYGNRRTTTTGAGTTSLSWDLNNAYAMLGVIDRPQGDGPTTTEAYTPWGTALATATQQSPDDRIYYLVDALGSTTDTIHPDGTPTARLTYDPFGASQGTTLESDALEPDLTYTSAYSEPALDNYALRARDYDPATGRFTSPDPLDPSLASLQQSAYVYVGNRPTLLTDPTGQCIFCDHFGIGDFIGDAYDRVEQETSYQTTAIEVDGWGGLAEEAGLALTAFGDGASFGLTNQITGVFGAGCINDEADQRYRSAYFAGVAASTFLTEGSAYLSSAKADRGRRTAPAESADHLLPIGPGSEKAWNVLNRVDAKGAPLPGYKGGKVFENTRGRLPQTPGVTYREWDTNPYVKGVNRGPERIVTGSDGSAYWTGDHYDTSLMFRGPTQ
jgi:RHS repeat-associated protein